MNVLPLVLSILLILTFGFYSCLEKEVSTYRINKTFLNWAKLSRDLIGSYEKENYQAIKAAKKIKSPNKLSSPKEKTKQKKEIPKPPPINPECARLNLWPLIYEDKEVHMVLYERLAHLLRLYYQKPLFSFFSTPSELEYRFLDAWLLGLRKNGAKQSKKNPLVLEKTAFKDPSLQVLYYNMLRGSKGKYPSLLDFVKASPPLEKKEKLCLLHATPSMLAVFFGPAAEAVYEEMHSETLSVTEERIEEICRRAGVSQVPKEFFKLLNLSRFKHAAPSELTLWEEDAAGDMAMRKKVRLSNNT